MIPVSAKDPLSDEASEHIWLTACQTYDVKVQRLLGASNGRSA